MISWDNILTALIVVQREFMLFAAVGLLIGGLDDLVIDIFSLTRSLWRSIFIYSRHERMTSETLPLSSTPGQIAVFVPTWRESGVIAQMLRQSLLRWNAGSTHDYRIFVGAYPNDGETIAAIARVARENSRVHLVIHMENGPTTKADCLNRLWLALKRDEEATGRKYKAIVLHDAEDVVHRDELTLFDSMIDRFDMVQLPVRPLVSQQSRWISGHYCDEFAESHGKTLATREALGAAVPSAGVGCAFARPMLGRIALQRDGMPFDPHSLTEDYEIGLRIAELKGRTIFVRMRDSAGALICTQEHFPETLETAVKQKARWFVGISLAGWDRMGWHGSLRERWMRLHDRRATLSALVLIAAYVATLGYGALMVAGWLHLGTQPPISAAMRYCLYCTSILMLWRLLVRAYFSGVAYGWTQGFLSIPRAFIANIIAILAARRALAIYIGQLRGKPVVWHKTAHRFPDLQSGAT
jgi:adsorption protein B